MGKFPTTRNELGSTCPSANHRVMSLKLYWANAGQQVTEVFVRPLERRRKKGWAIITGLVALIGVFDYHAGIEVSLAIFYLVPIALATGWFGSSMGVAASVACTIMRVSIEMLIVYPHPVPWHTQWNALASLMINLLVVWLLHSLLTRHCHVESEVEERTSQLAESDRRFRDMLENVGLIAVTLDREGHVMFCNDYLLRLTGWKREEVIGQNWFLKFIPGPDAPATTLFFAMIATGNIPLHCENPIRTRNGDLREIHWNNTMLRNGTGEIVGTASIGEDVTDRTKAEAELHAAERQLHALVNRLHLVREEEAKRIARELHDDLGQHLTALNMEIDGLQAIPPGPATEREVRLAKIREMVNHTIDMVQKIAGELRLGQLDILGLPAAVEWELQQFQRRSGLRCAITRLSEVEELTDDQATAVFRIIQEALTNIARHAGATAVEVGLTMDEGQLRVEIRDNGRGITPEELADRTAFGLLGMRERIQALGGQIVIDGNAGRGTSVVVTLPVPASN